MGVESECISIDGSLAYVAGELDAARSGAIEAHLERCADCRTFVVRLVESDGPASAEPSLLLPGDRVHRYEIVEPIGAGGMGVVYAARDPVLDRRVALKLVRPHAVGPEGLARLGREASALAQLSHPNVVAVYDILQDRGQLAIAMELVEGLRLDAWLATARPHWREIVRRFAEIAEGLAAAHAVGVVHRDVKPSNLLVGHDGRARVSDFGIARRTSEPVREGELAGTPAFMAPEQRRGEEATPASDQYALCLALYWSLYGARPHADAPVFPRAPRITARLRAAIARGLRPQPDARWPSLRALLEVLHRPDPPWRRNAAIAGIAAVAVGLAFAGGNASADRRASWCDDARTIAGWNDDARGELRRALGEDAEPVIAGLDGYAQALAQANAEACAVEPAPEQVLAEHARFGCLRERERLLAHVVGELVAGRADVAQTQWPLLEPQQCLAPDRLLQRHPLPALASDAELDAIADARADMLAARISFGWGELGRANELLDDVESRPITRAFPMLESEAIWARVVLGSSRGDISEAEVTALRFQAAASATATGHAWVAAMTWLELADWAGPEHALGYVAIARGHILALGERDPNLAALLVRVEARAHRLAGDLASARAVVEGELATSDDAFWRASLFGELAEIDEAAGDYAAALHDGEQAIAAGRHVEEQPPLWRLQLRVRQSGRMLLAARFDEARMLARSAADEARARALGPFALGYVGVHLAIAELVGGDPQAARVAAESARSSFEAAGAGRGLMALCTSLVVAADMGAGEPAEAAKRVDEIATELNREPRDEALAPADHLTGWLAVALAVPPTHPDRRAHLGALQAAAAEIPQWDLAATRRDPYFAWLWRALVRSAAPAIVEPLRATLQRDGGRLRE